MLLDTNNFGTWFSLARAGIFSCYQYSRMHLLHLHLKPQRSHMASRGVKGMRVSKYEIVISSPLSMGLAAWINMALPTSSRFEFDKQEWLMMDGSSQRPQNIWSFWRNLAPPNECRSVISRIRLTSIRKFSLCSS